MNDQGFARPRRYGPEGQVTATMAGAIIWGGMFARLGSMTDQLLLGCIGGTIIGAIVGFGFAKGLVGPTVPCMSAFAFLGALLGPACDYDPLSSSLFGAGIGAFVCATGLRGILALTGGLMCTNEGLFSGEKDGWFGFAIGGGIGWCLGHSTIWIWRRIRLSLGMGKVQIP